MSKHTAAVAGIDVGTECAKAIILDADEVIIGRSAVAMQGGFATSAQKAMSQALYEAKLEASQITAVCGTGFGGSLAPTITSVAGETMCHAVGAYYYLHGIMSVLDIGGREPRLIHVDEQGRPTVAFTVRRCAVGIGTFLMQAARYLDSHPSRLQELASDAETAVRIGSYCSTSAIADVQERLREGASHQAIALGCIHSAAERIVEIEGFRPPIRVTGGVPELFPGVLWALAELTGLEVEAVPEPIMAGALGAALTALRE